MTGAAEALHATLCIATAIWALHSLPTLRRPGRGRSLWAAMVALSVGEALHTQTMYRAVEHATGSRWPAVLNHSAGIITATAVLDAYLTGSRRARLTSALTGAGVLVLAAVPLLTSPPDNQPHPLLQDVPVTYAPTWQSALHWAAFLSYLAWALVFLAWQSARHARSLERGPPRTSMCLISAGAATGLLTVIGHATIEITTFAGGTSLVRLVTPLDALTLAPSSALIVTGTAWLRITELREQLHQYADTRATRRRLDIIRPHWEQLIHELPDISPFAADVRAPATTAAHLHWQQTRMIVEIYDALHQLSPHVSDTSRGQIMQKVIAHGLHGSDAQAATTAICLHLAIAAHRTQTTPTHAASYPTVPAATAADAAAQLARNLRRLQRRRINTVIVAVIEEEGTMPADGYTSEGPQS